MKKISSYLFALLMLVSFSFLTSCGNEPDPLPTEELPEANGTVKISFRNIPGTEPSINAAPGDLLVVSVLMEKSPDGARPQKLRIYETTTLNTRGTQVKVEGGNTAGTIDLRNVDSQTKTIEYTVPSNANGKIYLYFEVDESQDKFSRKVLTINVGNTAGVDAFTNITLGAQNNAAASRMSSATGYVYAACEVEANINYIDITYASTGITTNYLSSNPARFQAPINLTVKTRDCGAEGTIATDGGTPTYFAVATAADFDNATDASLTAINFPTSAPQYIIVQGGLYYAFKNSKGKVGVIKVNSLTGGATGTINIDVKVQR